MKRLTIIVPDSQTDLNTVSCIAGAYEIFSTADKYWRDRGNTGVFKTETAGISKKANFRQGFLEIVPQTHISAIPKTNLIIIPSSLIRSYEKAGKGNQMLINWIAKQYKEGAEVASMCTGAFMLASTGLLDGKNCSTHWSASEEFRYLFPRVKLRTENFITDEDGIYTNGGGYSFLNLLIYLVEKYYDRPTSIYCSKLFQIEIDRTSQLEFAIFTGQKLHNDEMVKKAQEYIEGNAQDKISFESLSSRLSVSRRNFDRRFVKATGITPFEYSQRVKIELAKKALETTRKAVNEVMFEVGYSDEKAFRETFRKITGISPLRYRKRYNKEASL